MPKLNPTEIGVVALQAGFPRDVEKLRLCIAIALAESGGNSDAVGPTSDYGLWQIHVFGDPKKDGVWRDKTKLLDPAFNAKAMMAISSGGTNWSPWVTYTTKKYASWLLIVGSHAQEALAKNAIAGTPLGTVTDGVIEAGDAIDDAKSATKSLSNALSTLTDPKFVQRVAKVVIGIVLLIVALIILNRDLVAAAVDVAL